ncbi:MAG TPA: PDZ domain-containing protein [Desulfomonilia bacterium]|jgi:general secretion pathway protein C|nr:PDZ domain-containing protein [Thermodesulfobacteriota bacterium]HWR69418.1 PDZ domain-containing protein [Desulfomonilia bacterium]
MDRRYKLAAVIVMITLFAWVIAGILTDVLGHVLYEQPRQMKAIEVAKINKDRPPKNRGDYEVITSRDLLKVTKARPSGADQPLSGDVERPLAQMGILLRGTITGPSEIARAIIEEAGDQKLFRIGESLKGATLIAIFRNKVIMEVNGQQQMLVVEESRSSPSLASASGRTREPRRPRYPATAGARGGAEAMRNMDQLIGNARVVPYYRGGQPYGFRVSDVVEGSEIYTHGIRSGDIIKSVNGVPIRTPQDALSAYQELQSGSTVQMEVERQGTTTSVSVPLR